MNKYLFLAIGLALLAGCSTPPHGQFESRVNQTKWPATTNMASVTLTNPLSPEMLQPTGGLFTLGPGDAIDIDLLGLPATSPQAQVARAPTIVGPDGKIYYSLLPGLDVWGLTLPQTTDLLEKELGKYMNSPHVSVTLRAVGSKHVWILGRVNRPGIFPLSSPTTVLELVAQAGGASRSQSTTSTATELADWRHTFIVRQGQFLPVNFYKLLHDGDVSQNIYLQPDDFVYVPSQASQEVYVLGAVRLPRAIQYTERMTVVSAIAGGAGMERYDWVAAGGYDPGPFAKDAYLSHVAVLRGSLSEPQIAIVDYNAIVKGRASDILLEPGDIVYVPNSPYTTLKRYFNIVLNTFVTTIAANEGIRAGGGAVTSGGVGVSVPVGTR